MNDDTVDEKSEWQSPLLINLSELATTASGAIPRSVEGPFTVHFSGTFYSQTTVLPGGGPTTT